MKHWSAALSLAAWIGFIGASQTEREPGVDRHAEAIAVVRTWFELWSEMADSETAVDELASLYRDDALHITGPTPDQIGTATYRGPDHVRTLARRFLETYDEHTIRIEMVSAQETSVALLHTVDGPWGGTGVAVAYVAAFTERSSGKRFVHPGAAFFQIQEGKIRRARFYRAWDELAEVVP